ncbi:hypothetical protein [Maricaulis sp. CAU 1757]
MSNDVHYEIFFKKNSKASWGLCEALADRDAAIRVASNLVAKNKGGSVRVTKERFNDGERAFRSVTVFEKGAEKFGEVKEQNAAATLPCLTPDDLSKPHARDTIRRVLTSWFERVQALPMELLHRDDLVENLEGSGTELQHAVQKVAVASAKDSDASVQNYMKLLNELVQKSLARIYQDARAERLPTYPKKATFSDVAQSIHDKDKRAYFLRAAIADRLRHERRFSDKLDALMEMADTLPEDKDARAFAVSEVDAYIAEVISFDAGFDALLGKCKDLGETLERLACLFDGDHSADALKMAPGVARRLARKIGSKEFDACRSVIANALLKRLELPRRLRPSSVRQEVRLARDLAAKLVMCADNLLPADALSKAFTARSARLLQPETIDELLKHARDTSDQLERLLSLEENLVGASNKQKLGGFIRSILSGAGAESFFVRGKEPALTRLSSLAALQKRVLKGAYPREEKLELAASFDRLGMKIVDETKILNMVEGGDRPALDKATALLKLATGGALPLGQCSADAQARAMRQLKSTMGMQEAGTSDGKSKLRDIQSLFQQLGNEHQQIK